MKATRSILLLGGLLFGLLVFGAPAVARAADDAAPTLSSGQRLELLRKIKLLQVRNLHAKARRVFYGAPRPRAVGESRKPRRRVDPEYALRRTGDADYIVPEGLRLAPHLPAVRTQERYVPQIPERTRGLAANVAVSDPGGEEIGSSQNEPSIAAWRSYVLCAYNDWPSLDSLGSIQGFSYSVTGGQSFVDGGVVPAPENYIWTSDPVITVNEKTGEFYYCGLAELEDPDDPDPKNAVGVVRGAFSGNSFQWDTPRLVRVVSSSQHFLDKPWMAADSSSGNVYLSYTDFFPLPGGLVSNTIQLARTRDKGVTWDPEVTLNSSASNGNVQGSRPALGPNGEVYVTWKEIGPIDPGSDFMRVRKSTTRGASFGSENTVVEFFDNYGTGAPGFNREKSVALPSIAVDRSNGANRGRLYVTWNESLNWYDDLPVVAASVTETEYNDFFADPDLFTIGQTLLGTFRDDRDYDSWAFQAEQDSSYVFWADTVAGSTYRLRVWCADSLTRLTYTGHPELPLDDSGNQGVMVFTAPSTGLYYLDMTNANIEGRATGTYRILTGRTRQGAERGRDQRDVFVATSTDAASWSVPSRINQDPPRFDNWLPEVAAASSGETYLAWYDWRDAGASQCGGLSSLYAAHSDNGGATWNTLGSLSDALSNWTYVNSNLIPNQGDYLGLFANENSVYVAWTDGRLGSPDIYGALISLLPLELQVSGNANVVGKQVTIDWQFVVHRVVQATVYRRDGIRQLTLATVTSDAGGHITFVDTTASAGIQYVYSLGVQSDEGERVVGDVVVSITSVPLLVAPNPMRQFGVVTYSLPQGGDVEVMIHDVTGRRVRRLVKAFRSGGVQHSVGWNAQDDDRRLVRPGVYLVRVTFGGKTISKRVTVMP